MECRKVPSAPVIPQLRINEQRMKADFDELALIGATAEGGINRPALSVTDVAARAWFVNRLEESGLTLNSDGVGNLSGVLPCPNPDAPIFLIGSHLDSVENGGRYDGAVGVVAALECARTIREANLTLPTHLEVINFTDEEGSWFSFLGSLGFTGQITEEDLNDSKRDNAAFRLALTRLGLSDRDVLQAGRDLSRYCGFLELHIEQGDRLEQAQAQIGVVSRIVGRSTYNITFYGEAAHSATISPHRKKDALHGAVLFLNHLYGMVDNDFPAGMVNCGDMSVYPGAYNIVPSRVMLRVEIRHEVESVLREMERYLVDVAYDCAEALKLRMDAERIIHRPVANLSEAMKATIEQVCEEMGLRYMRLPSYAGHDGQILDRFIPSAMIFVPSVDGISHSPLEYTRWESIVTGANVMLQTLLRTVYGDVHAP